MNHGYRILDSNFQNSYRMKVFLLRMGVGTITTGVDTSPHVNSMPLGNDRMESPKHSSSVCFRIYYPLYTLVTPSLCRLCHEK